MTCEVDVNGRTRRVEVERTSGGFAIAIDGRRLTADVTTINGLWSLILTEGRPGRDSRRRSYEVAVVEQPPGSGNLTVHVDGRPVAATVGGGRGSWARRPEDAGARTGNGPHAIVAPMPGKVVKVLVSAGDAVGARQGIVVVEAMKMENELRAPRAGTVAEVRVSEGASVEAGTVLVVVE